MDGCIVRVTSRLAANMHGTGRNAACLLPTVVKWFVFMDGVCVCFFLCMFTNCSVRACYARSPVRTCTMTDERNMRTSLGFSSVLNARCAFRMRMQCVCMHSMNGNALCMEIC